MSGMIEESMLASARLRTDQKGWETIGTITESQTTLGGSARDWDSVKALATAKVVKKAIYVDTNAAEFRFQTDSDDDSHIVELWAARGQDHYARVAILTLTGGTQVGDSSQVFIDTIVESTLWWPRKRTEKYDSGNNSICRYWIDLLGYSKLLFIATTLESGTTLTIQMSRA